MLRPILKSGVSTRLAASVAPLVKVTWAASAPASAATSRRAVSTAARAARPSRWTEDGLPASASADTRTSRTAGKSGAVAFQSIYVRDETVMVVRLYPIFHAQKRIFLEITVALAL
ncbi:exported hypothetical protein [Agrobacterium salinitolerans str. Hayward 0363]|nr:exported hypothetical protein [Agrobacterium salinitolerans str. Hayward 0363]